MCWMFSEVTIFTSVVVLKKAQTARTDVKREEKITRKLRRGVKESLITPQHWENRVLRRSTALQVNING